MDRFNCQMAESVRQYPNPRKPGITVSRITLGHLIQGLTCPIPVILMFLKKIWTVFYPPYSPQFLGRSDLGGEGIDADDGRGSERQNESQPPIGSCIIKTGHHKDWTLKTASSLDHPLYLLHPLFLKASQTV